MKVYRIISLSVLLGALMICASCTKKVSVPRDIVQPDDMVEILEEISWYEGFFATQSHFHYDKFGVEMHKFYDSIFHKYDISQAQFDSSISWYSNHPSVFEPICDSVLARITAAADAMPMGDVNESGAEISYEDPDAESLNEIFF